MAISKMFTQMFQRNTGMMMAGSIALSALGLGAPQAEAAPSAPVAGSMAATATLQAPTRGTQQTFKADCNDPSALQCRTGTTRAGVVTANALDVTNQWALPMGANEVTLIAPAMQGDEATARVAHDGRMTNKTVKIYRTLELARAAGVDADTVVTLGGRDMERFAYALHDDNPRTTLRLVINENCSIALRTGQHINYEIEQAPPVVEQPIVQEPPTEVEEVVVVAPPPVIVAPPQEKVHLVEELTIRRGEVPLVLNHGVDFVAVNGADVAPDGPVAVTMHDRGVSNTVVLPDPQGQAKVEFPVVNPNIVEAINGRDPIATGEAHINIVDRNVNIDPDAAHTVAFDRNQRGFQYNADAGYDGEDGVGELTGRYVRGDAVFSAGVGVNTRHEDAVNFNAMATLDLWGQRGAAGHDVGHTEGSVSASYGNVNFVGPRLQSLVNTIGNEFVAADAASKDFVDTLALRDTAALSAQVGVDLHDRFAVNVGVAGFVPAGRDVIGMDDNRTLYGANGSMGGAYDETNAYDNGYLANVTATLALGGDNAANAPFNIAATYTQGQINYNDPVYKITPCDSCGTEVTYDRNGVEERQITDISAEWKVNDRLTVAAGGTMGEVKNAGDAAIVSAGETVLAGHDIKHQSFSASARYNLTGTWAVVGQVGTGETEHSRGGIDNFRTVSSDFAAATVERRFGDNWTGSATYRYGTREVSGVDVMSGAQYEDKKDEHFFGVRMRRTFGGPNVNH